MHLDLIGVGILGQAHGTLETAGKAFVGIDREPVAVRRAGVVIGHLEFEALAESWGVSR